MEQVVSYQCHHHPQIGILHKPPSLLSKIGVLIVVGGPQYRVGSHRQFVQLSRSLSNAGVCSFRFDYRGMGDSLGAKQAFDALDDDLKAAVDVFLENQPELNGVVIWGLCDAASAGLIYAPHDKRVKGLVLLNPWFRGLAAEGKMMLKYYYIQRMLSWDFWKKLLTGGVDVFSSAKEISKHTGNTLNQDEIASSSYQKRMADGFTNFKGPICLLLSGNDLTAREFEEGVKGNKQWRKLKSRDVTIHKLPAADHTFSALAHKREVERLTTEFLLEKHDST